MVSGGNIDLKKLSSILGVTPRRLRRRSALVGIGVEVLAERPRRHREPRTADDRAARRRPSANARARYNREYMLQAMIVSAQR